MNKSKLSTLCAKAMGFNLWTDSSGSIPAIYQDRKGKPLYVVTDYNPLENADQADALLEYVADWRCWYLMRETAGYICYIETLKEKATPYCKTQNLAKILCALRASPEVTDAEINDAMEGE
jgi:hypothetical protein